jgi:TRAP-type C4-dicarboxylate transport system permease small subunit
VTLRAVKRGIDRVVDAVAQTMLAALAIVVFAAVIARYLIHAPLAWSEEVSRYLFIWLSLLGAETALRAKAHLGVDILLKHGREGGARWHWHLINGLLVSILAAVLVGGIETTRRTADQFSPALGIPIAAVYAAVPVATSLMLAETLLRWFTRGQRGEE